MTIGQALFFVWMGGAILFAAEKPEKHEFGGVDDVVFTAFLIACWPIVFVLVAGLVVAKQWNGRQPPW